MASSSWLHPEGTSEKLKLYNSLTRQKELFIPRKGRHVRWYSCGPTVYDASHMGHARSYITFDILRRVMQDYFGYDIEFVMNITDVDDKIIVNARRHHLFENYIASKPSNSDVIAKLEKTLATYKEKVEAMTEAEADKKKMKTGILVKSTDALEKAKAATNDETIKVLLQAAKDPLAEALDKEMGSDVTDHSIFTTLTKKWEADFHADMSSLNVLPADRLTRVTEYVPEVVDYVQQIIMNGFGYESNGSVYFDTKKFAADKDHRYGKLVPEAVGDLSALAEGEGELAAGTGDKRSENDFALWKNSKPGEPAWDSPWGKGRPGWHIECSAMAGDSFQDLLDIHTGGVDLKFPHHENEIAQAEAYYGCDQWCNYFLHSGHLNIEGLKMSKSLKNFITIKEVLKDYSSSQLRLAFLTHQWNATLDYSGETMRAATFLEKLFQEFFLNVKDILRNPDVQQFQQQSPRAKQTMEKFRQAETSIHNALCDNIDTVSAMRYLREIVSEINVYFGDCEKSKEIPNGLLVEQIAVYVTRFLKMLGVLEDDDTIGFVISASSSDTSDVDIAAQTKPFFNTFADFYKTLQAGLEKRGEESNPTVDAIKALVAEGLARAPQKQEIITVV